MGAEYSSVRLVLTRFRWFFASGDDRDAEIFSLRHQLLVLQRQINRAQFTDTDRTILAILARVFDRRRLAEVLVIVKPATVIGWHRRSSTTTGPNHQTHDLDGRPSTRRSAD